LGKNKIKKFAEMKSFGNVFQPGIKEIFRDSYYLKGKWSENYFGNDHPIILELGCGKGEYTIRLAEEYPSLNFIGMDIKGARIWTGAKYALDHNLKNVAFIRARIDFITSFFTHNEINEIWIPFPDPQIKRRRHKKKLTGSSFLKMYRLFLADDGPIHLKTDNKELFEYTRKLILHNKFRLLCETENLYGSDINGVAKDIRTYYENQFLEKGMKIFYLSFSLNHDREIEESPDE
jgi:tRNA (guanine-N7-)-methyltransferase